MSSFNYILDPDLVRRQQKAVEYIQSECTDTLGVVTWGTRGSKDVCAPNKMHYGGNTTCLELKSKYFHPDFKFFIDAGGGMQPAGEAAGNFIGNIISGRDHAVVVGFTHYHWDHIVGLPFTAFPFIDKTCLYLFGPKDKNIGPKEAIQNGSFRKPFFPIPFQQIGYHFQFKNLIQPTGTVGLIHKDVLGIEWVPKINYLQKSNDPESTVSIGRIHHKIEKRDKQVVRLNECVKVTMHPTFHPDLTLSYRFDMPSGESFVFLTDHELQESVSQSLIQHIAGATCLTIDCQYKVDEYVKMFTGWGHGCDEYVVNLANTTKPEQVLLCHHDPKRADSSVDSLTNEVSKKYATAQSSGDFGIMILK